MGNFRMNPVRKQKRVLAVVVLMVFFPLKESNNLLSRTFKVKCYRSLGCFKLNGFLIFRVVFQKRLIKTTTKPFSKLTNNRPSNQSKSNGHTRASSLEASLGPGWPVCKLAFKVKHIDQPRERETNTKTQLISVAKKGTFSVRWVEADGATHPSLL